MDARLMTHRDGMIRVLHAVARLDPGGIETWLLHLARTLDREAVAFDFVLSDPQPGFYDGEFTSLGCRLYRSTGERGRWRYLAAIGRILRRERYNWVHSHHHYFSGYILAVAAACGVQGRIAHSHNDLRHQGRPRVTRWWDESGKRLIERFATIGFAASGDAAADLFGETWRSDSRWKINECALDFSAFAKVVDRYAVRAQLGFAEHDFVIGHVGSFTAQKNHVLIVEVFRAVKRVEPAAKLLLVGAGPTQDAIRTRLESLGLQRDTVMTGHRSDIPDIMMGAMDVFLFPSLHEGLGLAAVEAQAAGLPVVLSTRVPREADVVGDLVTRLQLSDSPEQWAAAVLAARDERFASFRKDALQQVLKSPYSIENGAARVMAVYSKV